MDKKQVAFLKKGITRNPVLPVLEYILIKDNKAVVSDLENSIRVPVGYSGTGLIPFKQLEAVTKAGPVVPEFFTEEVPIGEEGKTVTKYKAKLGNTVLETMDADDFPRTELAPEVPYEYIGDIDRELFSQIERAIPFVVKDVIRPMMQTVRVSDMVVATDAHKLFYEEASVVLDGVIHIGKKLFDIMKAAMAMGITEFAVYTKHSESAIEHRKEYLESKDYLEKTEQEKEEALKDYDDRHPRIYLLLKAANGVEIESRMVDAKYPTWQAVIPKAEDTTVIMKVTKASLLQTIAQVMHAANGATFQIRLTVFPDKATLHAEDVDLGMEATAELSCFGEFTDKWKGTKKEFEIAFNGKFMTGLLGAIKDPTIHLNMQAANRAIVINDMALLMPLMIEK